MEGKCYYCKKKLTERTIKRHMKNCLEMKKVIQDEFETEKRKRKQFIISLKDKYDKSTYCIYVSIDESLQLHHLDKFIRDIWVECCGHLSMFKIDYEMYYDNSDGNYQMNTKLKDVLHVGQKFEYEYDFGSTTELILEVVDEIEVSRKHSQIEIIARNNEKGVPNSPRDGVCAYVCNKNAENKYLPGNNNTYKIDRHKPRENDVLNDYINPDSFNDDYLDTLFQQLAMDYEDEMQDTSDYIDEDIEYMFNKGTYSFDITEILKSYTKCQLSALAENMGIYIPSNLKKKEYIKQFVKQYEDTVTSIVEKYDEGKYKLLQQGVKNQGVIKFDKKEFSYQMHIVNAGIMFPCIYNESLIYVIPEIVQNILITNNTIQFRKKIKNNTETIKIVSGILYAYGVISCEGVMQLLSRYGYDFSNIDEIISIIGENLVQEADSNMIIFDSYGEPMLFMNKNIENYIEVVDLIYESCKIKIFDKEKLLLMGESDYLENSIIGKTFINDLLTLFSMSRDEAVEYMNMMALDIQYRTCEEISDDVIDGIDVEINKEEKALVKNVLNKFLKNIPLWKYKGHTINEIESYNDKKKIEKNKLNTSTNDKKSSNVIELFPKK